MTNIEQGMSNNEVQGINKFWPPLGWLTTAKLPALRGRYDVLLEWFLIEGWTAEVY